MNAKLDDVWNTRDFPMLVAIMKQVEAAGLPVRDYEIEIELEEEDQRRALRALESQDLITASYLIENVPDGVKAVDGRAYALTGLHPDGDDVRERLVSLLEKLAENTDNEEEASRIKKAAKHFGMFSRDTAACFVSGVASGMLG